MLPEHNRGMYTVPQILTNHAEYFLRTAKELEEVYGYREINLNLGCPSRTVVSKGKGAGFLGRPEELDDFFRKVFDSVTVKVSVKTRIGVDSPEEFEGLMEIFNKYPLSELIIHPRMQKDYYRNTPDWQMFGEALLKSRNSVCYNGDIFTLEDYRRWKEEFPTVESLMLGRGLLMNPALAEEIAAEKAIDPRGIPEQKRLKAFHDRLYDDYKQVMSGEKNVLFKMKEFWVYAEKLFPEEKKLMKEIKKASHLCDYEIAVRKLLQITAL